RSAKAERHEPRYSGGRGRQLPRPSHFPERHMAKATPATLALDKAGIAFTLHEYAYDPAADRVGLQAAAAMGVDPGYVFKTLLILADGKPACAIVASDRQVAMKQLAAALD